MHIFKYVTYIIVMASMDFQSSQFWEFGPNISALQMITFVFVANFNIFQSQFFHIFKKRHKIPANVMEQLKIRDTLKRDLTKSATNGDPLPCISLVTSISC